MPLSKILNVANMSFNAIRENKIVAKISGFTVVHVVSFLSNTPPCYSNVSKLLI